MTIRHTLTLATQRVETETSVLDLARFADGTTLAGVRVTAAAVERTSVVAFVALSPSTARRAD